MLISCTACAVEKLLGSAQPSVEFTRKKYVEAHDAFVASAAYTNALETAAHVLNKVSGLSPAERCISQHFCPSPGLACGQASVVITLSVSRGPEGAEHPFAMSPGDAVSCIPHSSQSAVSGDLQLRRPGAGPHHALPLLPGGRGAPEAPPQLRSRPCRGAPPGATPLSPVLRAVLTAAWAAAPG